MRKAATSCRRAFACFARNEHFRRPESTRLEAPTERGADPAIGHDLDAGILPAHRYIHTQLGAEFVPPRVIELRPHGDEVLRGIIIRRAARSILAFGFPRHERLQGKRLAVMSPSLQYMVLLM